MGRAVVTEGPFIDLTMGSQGIVERPGGALQRGDLTVRATFTSTEEFGSLKTARIIAGMANEKDERILIQASQFRTDFDHSLEYALGSDNFIYIRAECDTFSGKLCFTNPIWVD